MEIKTISEIDADLISDFFIANTDHLKPWEPLRPLGFHSKTAWQKRRVKIIEAQNRGESLHFFAMDKGLIVANCNLTQIVRGPFDACYMGYSVDKHYEGKGVAYQICRYAIEYAFVELALHRIMANYMPHNNRSAKLLARLGFVKEGVAKNYVKIQGKWENHVLTSLTISNHL